ncbi:DNA-binding transcriptional LysR family regulator [Herbaspirillum sp. 1173]|uniref:LysR family transcriptional regulator n=1 Tax=Herbaspirillum TaxID=963 RepID=UPI00285E7D3B|nr:LysR family transcriptional regulator [Herbaspirillum sp. 1173]MDR6742893.1 DNA-binding transcriptional LysR family regulator [Herbaspirillum sp. 1173]
MDSFSGISVFIQAVEAGSFIRAAERLHLTRSAVGKSIARLEERLGVRLFQRNTRSQSLTAEGRAYYERCLRALEELESAQALVGDGQREPAGQVRISTPVLFGRLCVAPVLVELARRWPQLDIVASFTDRRVDLIAEGVDLVLRSGPMPDTSDLVARRMGAQTMMLYASPDYLAQHGRPRHFKDLARHHGILYGKTSGWPIRDETGEVRIATVSSRLRFDDLEAIADATVAGAGLAHLPCWLIRDHLKAGRLVKLMPEASFATIDMHLAWPLTRHLPLRVRTVIDALAAALPPLLRVDRRKIAAAAAR